MEWTASALMPPGGFFWAFMTAGAVIVFGLLVVVPCLRRKKPQKAGRRYELWVAGRSVEVLEGVTSDEEGRQYLRDRNSPTLPYRGAAAVVTTSKIAIWCLEPDGTRRLVCGYRG